MNGVESIADVATGGLVARAVEPEAGEATGHAGACLNCRTALVGDYCHRCGQAGHVHRTLTAFWHDLLHGVLHFEGKIWRTLPMLAWRPGDLTRRYVAGERARFVSPLALFLFSVFLTFAVVSWTGGPLRVNDGQGRDISESLADDIGKGDRKIATLERMRVEAVAAGRTTGGLDRELTATRDEVSMLRLMKERGITEATMVRASDDLPEGFDWLQGAYRKAKANPSLLLYKLQNNAYKYSWALIPISVPFVWLLFPFNRAFRIYDHAVFVTYSLCFMTLLLAASSIVTASGADGVAGIALSLVPPVHMYRQLRGAYRLGRLSAALRTVLLLVFSFICATLFTLVLVMLGVVG